jgi:hypothetical protein
MYPQSTVSMGDQKPCNLNINETATGNNKCRECNDSSSSSSSSSSSNANTFKFLRKQTIASALGSAAATLQISNAGESAMGLTLKGNLNDFEAGKLFAVDGWGKTNMNFDLSQQPGKSLLFKANEVHVAFKGYTYSQINLNGSYAKNILQAGIRIDDPNLNAALDTRILLNNPLPHTLIDAVVHSADLQALRLVKSPLTFTGKTAIDIEGNKADNLNGTASFKNLSLFRGNQAFVFDSIKLQALIKDSTRAWTLQGKDIEATLEGRFEFADLKSTFSQYFSNYYPIYIKRMPAPKKTQDIRFNFELKNASSILKLLDIGLADMNYSKIDGRINTENNIFRINATIPKLQYKKLALKIFLKKLEKLLMDN